MTTDRAPVPHRLATTLWALVVPALLVLAGVAAALAWRADLPDPIAVHWDSAGPDGFGSLGGFVLATAVTTLALAAFLWAVGFFAGHSASTRRLACGFAVGFALFMVVLQVGTLWIQRGVAQAGDAGGVGGVLAACLIAGLSGGMLAAAAVPGDARVPAGSSPPVDAPRIGLAAGEVAVWTRRVWFPGTPAVVALTVALGVVTGLATGSVSAAVTVALVLAVLLAMLGQWTVLVDASGLTVQGWLRWPRTHVPLDEIESAAAVEVSPLREFGGWGYRVGRGGRVGVVLRRGEAIEVFRSAGRRFVVTVDDAQTGAALLNTLADQARISKG